MSVFFTSRKTGFKSWLDTSSIPCYLSSFSSFFLNTISTPPRYLVDRSRKLLSPRQLLDSCIYRGLKLDTSRSIEIMETRIFRSDFWARLLYLCKVSFLTTLNLYKAYFRGRHIRENKENICKK